MKRLFDILIRDYWENIQKMSSLNSLKSDWFKALLHFKEYAYERNISGAAEAYREVANKVLESLKTRTRWSCDMEKNIWNNFREECRKRNIKPNKRVNPLKPSTTGKEGLVKFVWDVSDYENKTIANWAFKMICENKIRETHDRLKTVWGVGDKIASFYLRDIYWLGHKLTPQTTIDDDYLLQPVDIWVDRAAAALGNKQKSRLAVAKCISSFERNNGIPHGGANIGFWMLGSTYLVDTEEFENVIKGVIHRQEIILKKL